MKKLIHIPISLTFLLTFSCGQNSAERKLNGKWYETENPEILWVFNSDKLEFIDEDNVHVDWSATDSKIEFTYQTYVWDSQGKAIDSEDKILIEYTLSENEDTLSGTLTNSFGKHKFGLIRTE